METRDSEISGDFMSDGPIRSTPRRQRILLGLPYGLSAATLQLMATSATGQLSPTREHPVLPEAPDETMDISRASDLLDTFERSFPRAPRQPTPARYCASCSRRISNNKAFCARCAPLDRP